MNLKETFHLNKHRIALLFRYGVSGLTGVAVQTGILYVWVSLLGLKDHYLWGSVVGLCVALCITFALQKYWTFKDTTHHTVHIQFVSYVVVALMNLGVNTLLLHLSKVLVDSMGLNFFAGWYLVCQVIVLGFVAMMSFFANYFFTFRSHTRAHKV